MEMDWGAERPEEGQTAWDFTDVTPLPASGQRLDSLFPSDSAFGAVSYAAVVTYLTAMMEMVARHHLPLTLLRVGLNPASALHQIGTEGRQLVACAVARCLRQETRPYDVVGLADERPAGGIPSFLVVCPLMGEAQAASLAERLLQTMELPLSPVESPSMAFSIGIAAMALDAPDAEALMARALSEQRMASREGGGIWRHSDTKRRIAEQNSPFPFQEPEE